MPQLLTPYQNDKSKKPLYSKTNIYLKLRGNRKSISRVQSFNSRSENFCHPDTNITFSFSDYIAHSYCICTYFFFQKSGNLKCKENVYRNGQISQRCSILKSNLTYGRRERANSLILVFQNSFWFKTLKMTIVVLKDIQTLAYNFDNTILCPFCRIFKIKIKNSLKTRSCVTYQRWEIYIMSSNLTNKSSMSQDFIKEASWWNTLQLSNQEETTDFKYKVS